MTTANEIEIKSKPKPQYLFEEPGSLHVDTHGSKHNSKVIFVIINNSSLGGSGGVDQTGLTTDLSGNLVVGQTSS